MKRKNVNYWIKVLIALMLGIFVTNAWGQYVGQLRVVVTMEPPLVSGEFCCTTLVEEIPSTFHVTITFYYLPNPLPIAENCTLEVDIDPSTVSGIVYDGVGYTDFTLIPGYSPGTDPTDFFIDVDDMNAATWHSLEFDQTFEDIGCCEDFVSWARIFSSDPVEQDSDSKHSYFFIFPETDFEAYSIISPDCDAIENVIEIEYCPHLLDIGCICDSICIHFSYPDEYFTLGPIVWPEYISVLTSSDCRIETPPGEVTYCFLGLDTCVIVNDEMHVTLYPNDNFLYCYPYDFTWFVEDFVDCNSYSGDGHEEQNYIWDTSYTESFDIIAEIDMQINRTGPDPLEDIGGDEIFFCGEILRTCLCPRDTAEVVINISLNDSSCPLTGAFISLAITSSEDCMIEDEVRDTHDISGDSGYQIFIPINNLSLTGTSSYTIRDTFIFHNPPVNNPLVVRAEIDYPENAEECPPVADTVELWACDYTEIIVTKESDENEFIPGDTVEYTIEIHNNGAIDIADVRVLDKLLCPCYGKFVGSDPDMIIWDINNLIAGQDTTLTAFLVIDDYSGFPDCDQVYLQENSVTVTATDAPTATDFTSITIVVDCFCYFDLNRNSFNSNAGEIVEIRLMMHDPREVYLDVYNVAGERVKTIGPLYVPGGPQWIDPNPHWDGTDDNGNTVPSGAYYIVLRDEYKWGDDLTSNPYRYRCEYKPINVYNK